MKSRKSHIAWPRASWRRRIARSANTVLRTGACRNARVAAGARGDLLGRHHPHRGGTSSSAHFPRVICWCHSAWCCRAQASVTVPRVIARTVPFTQIAA